MMSDLCRSTRNGSDGNITEVERQACLDDLQRKTTLAMLPAIIFLLCVSTVGIVGNTLVIAIYVRKSRTTPLHVLLIAIASFDLLANSVAIPGKL